ncbi:MAG: glycosyltransferase, partial [Cytophagales bacterium]|nr:glycosyltransferase [Cytophagales bacterium]
QAKYPIHLLELRHHPGGPPADGAFKKQGIAWAVGRAVGELIVTTDGDCTVPPAWLAALAGCHRAENAVMVCGAVTFAPVRETVFSRLQAIEFASLVASGAATLQLGVPTMCNAANLAFSREAFLAVDGYRDTASAATGDDLFLMHKLHKSYGNRVRFLKNPAAVVRTLPQPDLYGFYHQRKRWASKWHLYTDRRVTALAVFVFLCNVGAVAALPLAAAGWLSWAALGTGLALRWAAEWLFVGTALRFLGKGALLPWMPLVQAVYPFYVFFFGLAAQRRGYRWKGRELY